MYNYFHYRLGRSLSEQTTDDVYDYSMNVYHYRRPNVYRTCTVDPRRPVDVKFLVLTPNTYGV